MTGLGGPIGQTASMNARTLLLAPLLLVALSACGDDKNNVGSDDDFCTVTRDLDSGAFDAFSTAETPEEVEAAITHVVEELDRAEAVAPDEIKDSVSMLADVYDQIATGLEANNWDVEAFFTTDEAAALFEDFDDGVFDDLELYLEDECGIVTDK